jgi:hypothetical protein
MISNEEFLQTVFGDGWLAAHLASFVDDPTSETMDRKKWGGGAAKEKLLWAIPTRNNYFTVSLFARDDEGIARRRKALFLSMHLVVVDDVDEGKVKSETARRLLGEPSYRLETSPGNEQWGYLFDEPLRDRFAGELLVEAMVAQGLTTTGTDPGMKGVTRYVRLPVGTNMKAKYGATGFRTVLHEWAPERRYSPAILAQAFGLPDLAEAARVACRRAEMEREGLEGKGEDALLAALTFLGKVKDTRRRGDAVDITCPFIDTHTGRVDTGTAYMIGGGGISCHHGHCVGRSRGEYVQKIKDELSGIVDERAAEAAAVIYSISALADLRRSLRLTAFGLMRRGLKAEDRIRDMANEEIDDASVAEEEMWAAIAWAREKVQEIETKEKVVEAPIKTVKFDVPEEWL